VYRTALDDADQRAGDYAASFVAGSEIAVDGGWLAYGGW
jgi:hypothetical protein